MTTQRIANVQHANGLGVQAFVAVVDADDEMVVTFGPEVPVTVLDVTYPAEGNSVVRGNGRCTVELPTGLFILRSFHRVNVPGKAQPQVRRSLMVVGSPDAADMAIS